MKPVVVDRKLGIFSLCLWPETLKWSIHSLTKLLSQRVVSFLLRSANMGKNLFYFILASVIDSFDHQCDWVGKSHGCFQKRLPGVLRHEDSPSSWMKYWAILKQLKREKQLNTFIVLLLPPDPRRFEQAASRLPWWLVGPALLPPLLSWNVSLEL